jgi:glyoxylase-like metal-dependent hydrolase (beta-lactamase superfamily II)
MHAVSALEFPIATPPAPEQALEVAPGVLWHRMPLPFALDHINLWLVRTGDGYTAVDTGYGDAATRLLWQSRIDGAQGGLPIARIVVTHYHPDHVGNAAWLAARFGVPVDMTTSEFLTAHAVHADSPGYSVDDFCAHFRAHGMSDEDVAALRARGNRYRPGVPELPSRYRRILAGDVLELGQRQFRVIAGYGHSPEHAALFAPACAGCETPLLIAGDMLLPRISTNVAVGPADPEGDPLARFLASLEAYAALPPDTLVLPSHGLPFRGAAQRVAQLRAHHAARLAELADALVASAEPRAAADMLPVLFRRPLDLQQRFFAMGEAIAHLNHLWHAGRARRVASEGGSIRYAA